MRYIIALLAAAPELYIQEAQKYKSISEDYLLSSTSLPHITIAQFDLDSKALLSIIWNKLEQNINTLPVPHFIGFGLTQKFNKFWNLSLTVARDSELVALQSKVISVLHAYNLKCINEVGDLYRPHLTLARIAKLEITSFNDQLLKTAPFILAIGEGDINGQFLKVIHTNKI